MQRIIDMPMPAYQVEMTPRRVLFRSQTGDKIDDLLRGLPVVRVRAGKFGHWGQRRSRIRQIDDHLGAGLEVAHSDAPASSADGRCLLRVGQRVSKIGV